ncbi:VOC family protein [Luteococcus sp.]|uniref:VOC family protein n=1 Tax=Luteococcus sp. TaxID=1969402 RepID=UPI0037362BD6
MTRIDHAALYVEDLEAARRFFEDYFGARANSQYHNPTAGLRTYFLSFDDTARLEVMSRPGIDRARSESQLGWGHVAIQVGSPKAVNALAARLASDGYRITNGPRTTGDGYYEAVVLDAEGNEVEIVA